MKFSLVALLFAIVIACAPAQAPTPTTAAGAGASQAEVTGRVELGGGATLPARAVVEVTLLDTSVADAAAKTIARTEIAIETPANEVPFQLSYARDRIDPKGHITLAARATIDGQLEYTTTESYPAITHGNASQGFVLVLKPVK
jgi:putative lipoprotein